MRRKWRSLTLTTFAPKVSTICLSMTSSRSQTLSLSERGDLRLKAENLLPGEVRHLVFARRPNHDTHHHRIGLRPLGNEVDDLSYPPVRRIVDLAVQEMAEKIEVFEGGIHASFGCGPFISASGRPVKWKSASLL